MLSDTSEVKAFESFILEWNIENPVDRWWRSKHGVAFNSSLHRGISFIDMYMEYYEDSLYEKATKQKKLKEEHPYIPGRRSFLYPRDTKPGQKPGELSDEEFDNIEI
jgi:hypothetical protein